MSSPAIILAQLRAERSRATEAPAVAQALARFWSDAGLAAHAAITAQAELAVHLLRLNAPAPLLHGAARTLLDETALSSACLDLARRYGAAESVLPSPSRREGASDPERAYQDGSELLVGTRSLGTGSLGTSSLGTGSLDTSLLGTLVLRTLRRGCIAATVESSCAREALEHCQEPAAREVLLQLEHGRARSAQLSWRFLAWALRGALSAPGSSELADQVRVAVLTALGTKAPPAPLSQHERELLRHGVLGSDQRLAIEQRVLREVVLPCMENAIARARASRAV
jgi:hypothetical protein